MNPPGHLSISVAVTEESEILHRTHPTRFAESRRVLVADHSFAASRAGTPVICVVFRAFVNYAQAVIV